MLKKKKKEVRVGLCFAECNDRGSSGSRRGTERGAWLCWSDGLVLGKDTPAQCSRFWEAPGLWLARTDFWVQVASVKAPAVSFLFPVPPLGYWPSSCTSDSVSSSAPAGGCGVGGGERVEKWRKTLIYASVRGSMTGEHCGAEVSFHSFPWRRLVYGFRMVPEPRQM